MNQLRILCVTCAFFAFLYVFTSTSSAQADPGHTITCKRTKPSLKLKTATTRTKYIRTKSSKDLTEMHGSDGQVGGLGGGEIGFKANAKFKMTGHEGQVCVNLDRVEVTFFAKPEIHIASNFSRSTCEYNAVMAHEKKHIAELRKFVREYSPKVKKALIRDISKIKTVQGPVYEGQIAQAQNDIQKEIMAKIQAMNQKLMPRLSKRQKRIDNPKEYARVASKCKKWDQKFSNN